MVEGWPMWSRTWSCCRASLRIQFGEIGGARRGPEPPLTPPLPSPPWVPPTYHIKRETVETVDLPIKIDNMVKPYDDGIKSP